MKLETNPDELVTLVTKPTEFEAHAIVAVLEDAGIEAVAFGAMRAVLPLSEKLTPVPVQVRARDLERAREALKQNQEDSVDVDWNEVDVGERVDDLPLTQRKGMPPMARLGFLAACMMLLLILLVMVTRGLQII
jgi:hypothetical protein